LNDAMPQIRILPDSVVNKIAAGEVVERPASVVKELLENALDAGAQRITVEVEAGGKRLIRVTDDGCGMTRDDALLAFDRHATSKLRSPDDLLAIATLGFRGEALPSIASVARVRLETRAREDAVGTQIEINGGRMQAVKEIGCAPGTQVTVRALFYNVPARRKFLRSDTTEMGHVASLVTHYALAHPEIGFTLKAGSHTVLDAAPGHRGRPHRHRPHRRPPAGLPPRHLVQPGADGRGTSRRNRGPRLCFPPGGAEVVLQHNLHLHQPAIGA
jgi:DNA mismatch repair protein MutL